MSKRKLLFIDRDGTIIDEPADKQIDSLQKLKLEPDVIPGLLKLQAAGYELILVSNQDGLGTESFPKQDFDSVHDKLLQFLASQGIHFSAQHICPHFASDNCDCRKPKLGLVLDYLRDAEMDKKHSYVIGDRDSDLQLANNMCIQGILYQAETGWLSIVDAILEQPRVASITRTTKETDIKVSVNLDSEQSSSINTGIGFFDHMLEQIAKHAAINLQIKVTGDLHIDEHHTVEDTALALGAALREALDDKRGINRYGFLLAMDEALAHVAIDLGGRAYCVFDGKFNREKVGELPTELVPHFFHSLADTMASTINIKVTGENSHHMIESSFKGFGRALKQAIQQQGHQLPSTKGVL